MTLVEITTRRDIRTSIGVIPHRARVHAMPSGDGRWLLLQRLPQGGRRGRAVLVPPEWVVKGTERLKRLENQAVAHEEYEHARNVLGYGHDRAVLYVSDGMGVELKTLRDWGFDTGRLENEQRNERRGPRRVAMPA